MFEMARSSRARGTHGEKFHPFMEDELKKLWIASAVLVGVSASGIFLVATASAADETNCKTTTTHLNRPDHGHGVENGGYWTNLSITRTTKICVVPPAEAAKINVAPPVQTHYKATVKDEGTLVTIAGAHLSPNEGKALIGGIHGTVVGGYTQDFWAEAGWLNYQGNFDGGNYNGIGNPASTGNWVKAVWGGSDFKSEGLNEDWSWTYKTCSEQWIDAANNKDGQGEGAGDITGKPCASPSTSVTASPAHPSSTAAAPGFGQLPVTGSKIPLIVGSGVFLSAVGILLVWLFRKRRDETTFVVE